MATYKNNGCPKGYIMRKGYTRRFRPSVKATGFTVRRKGKVFTVRPTANTITVPAACIKDRGLPGKGPKEGEGIGKLRKGELIKYGYQYRLSDSLRQAALTVLAPPVVPPLRQVVLQALAPRAVRVPRLLLATPVAGRRPVPPRSVKVEAIRTRKVPRKVVRRQRQARDVLPHSQ